MSIFCHVFKKSLKKYWDLSNTMVISYIKNWTKFTYSSQSWLLLHLVYDFFSSDNYCYKNYWFFSKFVLLGVSICIYRFPRQRNGEECACQSRRHRRNGFKPGVEKILWSRKWQPTHVFFVFCLEDSMNRVTWWATVLRVTESDTTGWLGTHTYTYTRMWTYLFLGKEFLMGLPRWC